MRRATESSEFVSGISVNNNDFVPPRSKELTEGSRICQKLAPLVGLFLLATVFQPLLPRIVQHPIIALRFIIVPGLIALFLFSFPERILLVIFAGGFLCFEVARESRLDNRAILNMLTLLTALPFCRAGALLGTKEEARSIWHAVMLSMVAINLVTMGIYFDTLAGGATGSNVFEKVNRAEDDPLFRFALGNAIEIPALIVIASASAAVALRGSTGARYLPYALLLNLGPAFISQSRVVFLIALVSFLTLWKDLRTVAKAIFILIVTGLVLSKRELIAGTWGSLISRFSGNDDGSTHDRLAILKLMVNSVDISWFLLGHGIHSSFDFMAASGKGYRSVENVVLQLMYEIGLIGILLHVIFFRAVLPKAGLRAGWYPLRILIVAQMLLLLPLNSYSQLYVAFATALWLETSRGVRRGSIHIRS
jgi:hypothetical protein